VASGPAVAAPPTSTPDMERNAMSTRILRWTLMLATVLVLCTAPALILGCESKDENKTKTTTTKTTETPEGTKKTTETTEKKTETQQKP
jgi:hypothetical protein